MFKRMYTIVYNISLLYSVYIIHRLNDSKIIPILQIIISKIHNCKIISILHIIIFKIH